MNISRKVKNVVTGLALGGMAVAGIAITSIDAGVTTPRTYTVEAGDTYRNISTRLGLSESALACANRTSASSCPSVTADPGLGRIIQLSPVIPVGTTTTTLASTTTQPAATTTTQPSTTTTQPPTTTTQPSGGAGCGLSAAAFCETFSSAQPNPATRSGDLNPVLWGVSRVNTIGVEYGGWLSSSMSGPCGGTVTAPRDVRVCNGRVYESSRDGEGQSTLAMYPKQPFDIGGGRTGKIVFDVSSDSEGPHAAWPEFWWTDKPVPAPHGHLSANATYAANSFGISFANDQCGAGGTGVYEMYTTRNYQLTTGKGNVGCVTRGSATGGLNHVEIRISATHVDVYMTDAGATTLKLVGSMDIAMPLTRGVVWLEDVHYNAGKFNNQENHTFAWDNLGFDGPKTYRDYTFDVQDRTPSQLGYFLPVTVTAPGVRWDQTPSAASVMFNWFAYTLTVPDVRVNGGPWHSTAWPFDDEDYVMRTINVPIPFSEVHAGSNTIEFRPVGQSTAVSNIDILLTAAAPVP